MTVSSAVASTNPEVQEAFRLGIPVVDRRQWMPAATHGAEVVAAAGTHGKSTTAAMLGWALSGRCDGPFAALVGAHVPQLSHPSLGLHVEGAAAHAPSCRLSIGPVQGAPELGRDRGSMVVEVNKYL